MKKGTFERYLITARTEIEGGYSSGYQRGISRLYHGETYGTDEEHELWHSLEDCRGDGYRDGFAGKPPKGFHFNIGNDHAQKSDSPANVRIELRLTSSLKRDIQNKAAEEGLSTSAWIIRTLSKEIHN